MITVISTQVIARLMQNLLHLCTICLPYNQQFFPLHKIYIFKFLHVKFSDALRKLMKKQTIKHCALKGSYLRHGLLWAEKKFAGQIEQFSQIDNKLITI
jgi:hypothetical protein